MWSSTRRRSCASTATCRRWPRPSARPGTIAGRARRRSTTTRTAATRSSSAAIADYAGVEPENVVLGAGADDLILLCARAVRGAGRHGRDRGLADLPALPDRRRARRRGGRRRRPGRHVLLPPEQPDGGARRPARGAAARRRRGVLRVRGRDGRRTCSTTASSCSGRSRRRSGSRARASATRSPTARPPPS